MGFSQEEGGPKSQEGLSTKELNSLKREGNPIKRTRKAINLARKKLKAARITAQQGDTSGTKNAVKGFETALGHATASIKQGQSQGADLTIILSKVGDATLKHQETLLEIHGQVSDRDKAPIMHALEVSARGHNEVMNTLQNVALREKNATRRLRLLLNVADGRAAQARNAAQRGDSAMAQLASQNYANALNGSLNALSQAQSEGQNTAPFMNWVANATKWHQSALQDALGQVPDEAKKSIKLAMQASQNGNRLAVTNLRRLQVQRMQIGRASRRR